MDSATLTSAGPGVSAAATPAVRRRGDLAVFLSNLLTDALYSYLDPRIRYA